MACIYTKQFSNKDEELTEVECGRLFDAIYFYYHNNPSITRDDKEDILSVAKKLLSKEEVNQLMK